MENPLKIQQLYKSLVLEICKKPESLTAISDLPDFQDLAILDHYSSLNSIEKDILLSTFTDTVRRLMDAKEYVDYIAREKALAFFYTWLEELEKIRPFLKLIDEGERHVITGRRYLKKLEAPFRDFIEDLLAEGVATGELAKRPFVLDKYHVMLWLQVQLLYGFWIRDESEARERTDAAVEKSVNFVFDLMSQNLLDSGIDLLTFILKK